MRAIGRLGEMVWAQWDELRHAAAVIGTVLYVCVRPRYWVRTVRRAFVRQVVVIGVESVGFVGGVAVFVGITVVVQLAFWVTEAGQSQMLGPLLVAVVARELGPVLINIVVIVRSGSVMATELGIMKIGGRVHVLEAQGISPFLYLVMPRVLAAAVSTFCLTIVFILVALASGYLFGATVGKAAGICCCLRTPCRVRFIPKTCSPSSAKASCPPFLPAHRVASAGWASARR